MEHQLQSSNAVLALDVGDVRIGVAMASSSVGIPTPQNLIKNDDSVWQHLKSMITDNQITTVVVGLPRSLAGADTSQTAKVRDFAAELQKQLPELKVHFQDEAGTSVKAAEELMRQNGKKPRPEMSVDSLAATYILDDYLQEVARG